jgi:hypothetical protein
MAGDLGRSRPRLVDGEATEREEVLPGRSREIVTVRAMWHV